MRPLFYCKSIRKDLKVKEVRVRPAGKACRRWSGHLGSVCPAPVGGSALLGLQVSFKGQAPPFLSRVFENTNLEVETHFTTELCNGSSRENARNWFACGVEGEVFGMRAGR